MQDTKAKASVLAAGALSQEDVNSERHAVSVSHAVGTDAGGADLTAVEAVASGSSANCQPLSTGAEPEMSLHRSVGNGDGGIPAADTDTEGLSSSCSASSSAAVEKNDRHDDVRGSADDRCHVADILSDDADRRVCYGDVISCSDEVSAAKPASSDVDVSAATCDAELISPSNFFSSEDSFQTSAVTVRNGVMSHLDLGSILVESFTSTTLSAASVISTQATIGSPQVACETPSTSVVSTQATIGSPQVACETPSTSVVSTHATITSPQVACETAASSDLRTSTAGICPVLLFRLFHFLLINIVCCILC